MSLHRLNPDDFPDSPHARQLREGVSTRPFEPEIEAEFLTNHLDRVRRRVRIWYSFAALVATVFATVTLLSDGWSAPGSLLHLLLILPAIWAFVALVWSRHYERWFLQMTPFALLLFTTLAALNIAQVMSTGRSEALSSLVVYVVAAFFFSGLLYQTALTIASATVVIFVFSAAFYSGLQLNLLADTAMLVVALVLSAIVQRDVAIATRRSFLEAALVRDLVARDGLTGVMNRRAFDEHLRRVWQQGLRDNRRLAILLVDVDHFKAFNDTHGHQAGDSALRQIAQVLQAYARRPLDLAARYGGEEFAVILYDLDASRLVTIAEEIRMSVEKLRIAHGAPGAGSVVTISIGVGAVQPAVGRSIQGAIQFADEALYQAKEAGRNRVIVRGDEEYQALSTGTFASPKTIRVNS